MNLAFITAPQCEPIQLDGGSSTKIAIVEKRPFNPIFLEVPLARDRCHAIFPHPCDGKNKGSESKTGA